MKTTKLTIAILSGALTLGAATASLGQGMPAESREAIHKLFGSHTEITRDVKMTQRGYEAVTESDNPDIARAIKRHVSQMADRLKSGLMVRRWDPAFEEYVRYYNDIDHVFKPTKKGMKVIVTGKTDAAAKVAKNHAKVLAGFVADGWKAHDRRHPVAMKSGGAQTATHGGPGKRECCLADKPGETSACCKVKKGGAKAGKACCEAGKGEGKGKAAEAKSCCKAGAEGKGGKCEDKPADANPKK